MDAAAQASGHYRGDYGRVHYPNGDRGDEKILRDVWPRECAWGQLDEVLVVLVARTAQKPRVAETAIPVLV